MVAHLYQSLSELLNLLPGNPLSIFEVLKIVKIHVKKIQKSENVAWRDTGADFYRETEFDFWGFLGAIFKASELPGMQAKGPVAGLFCDCVMHWLHISLQ